MAGWNSKLFSVIIHKGGVGRLGRESRAGHGNGETTRITVLCLQEHGAAAKMVGAVGHGGTDYLRVSTLPHNINFFNLQRKLRLDIWGMDHSFHTLRSTKVASCGLIHLNLCTHSDLTLSSWLQFWKSWELIVPQEKVCKDGETNAGRKGGEPVDGAHVSRWHPKSKLFRSGRSFDGVWKIRFWFDLAVRRDPNGSFVGGVL